MTLAQLNSRYEVIMREKDNNKRDRQLSELMSEMERKYKIPMMRSEAWEEQNKMIIALYRKISLSRNL